MTKGIAYKTTTSHVLRTKDSPSCTGHARQSRYGPQPRPGATPGAAPVSTLARFDSPPSSSPTACSAALFPLELMAASLAPFALVRACSSSFCPSGFLCLTNDDRSIAPFMASSILAFLSSADPARSESTRPAAAPVWLSRAALWSERVLVLSTFS